MNTAASAWPVQKRALRTRSKLLGEARKIIAEKGDDGLRIEEVVARAGVAKGTFFSHFRDKDALFERIIGEDIDGYLDEMEGLPPPGNVADVVRVVLPMFSYMAASRIRFDIIFRYSGAAANAEIGPIAMTFVRRDEIMRKWLAAGPFRKDVDDAVLADGIDAFAFQAIALNFCTFNGRIKSLEVRLTEYLRAWLTPSIA
jgi:AcrR family transcriptional regulator